MSRRLAWHASAIALLLLWCASNVLAQAPGSRNVPSTATGSALKQVRSLLAADDLERARGHVEEALARDPASAEAHFLLGVVHERQRDFAAAATSYASAIRSAPRMAEAHDRLGFVLGQQGQTAQAIRKFEEAVHLNPRLFDAQYHLGATRWWIKDFDGALPALQAAVLLRPDHAEARYYLGLTL